jgi:hypothetical protein
LVNSKSQSFTCSSGCEAAMMAHLPGQEDWVHDADDAGSDAQSTCNMQSNRNDEMKSAQQMMPSGAEAIDSWNDCRSEMMLPAV